MNTASIKKMMLYLTYSIGMILVLIILILYQYAEI